MSIHEVNKKKL